MSETNYTPAQLEAWAGLGPWEAGRPDMATIVDGVSSKWIYSGNTYVAVASGRASEDWDVIMNNARLIAAAPDLARLVLEKDAEIARLRFGLNGIANLIKTNIIENDGPNRFHLDGVSYEGPEVDAFFRILRGLEKIARQAMKETSDGLF